MNNTSLGNNSLLILVVAAGLLYVVGQYVNTLPDQRAQRLAERPQITVQGQGEADAKPDVATIQLGVTTEPRPTSEQATQQLEERMNAIIDFLRGEGIEEKDIKTANVSVNPSYDFTDRGQQLRGYEAQQNLTVTIREVDRAGELVSGTTRLGANQIGGLNFDIDNQDSLIAEAQRQAIEDARTQAEHLAQALGSSLGRVVTFDTLNQPPGPPIPLVERAVARDEAALNLPPGQSTVTATVTVTYELVQ